ncbi:MAG: 2-amino-4-hydroxy-6-hydroxymethyldihydropteridine diphosphokinase [Lentisphaeria bacterium]|nr:2-amino-4-hydroxy-6-hydroxymethyldihydropteridine diphosphokinase [Lentisphaeria bacterium]
MALGSNKGDSRVHFEAALAGLRAGGFAVRQVSPYYETDPVDCEEGVPPFLNGAVSGIWTGTPEELLALCQSLERRAGRPEIHSSRQSRELDLDLILFGDRIIRTPRLTVPHPRAAQRAFVLAPLNDIAPDAVFPDSGKSAAQLLADLPDRSGVRRCLS